MKRMLAAALLAAASLSAVSHAADQVDDRAATQAPSTAPLMSPQVDALPPAHADQPVVATTEPRAIESAIAGAFRASEQSGGECSDRWTAYCNVADKVAGAVMMQAREKYEATDFVRDR